MIYMRFARNQDMTIESIGPKPIDRSELRRHGRVRTQGVECSIGEVLDLSASGMRVRTKFKLPDVHDVFVVTLFTMDGPLALLTKVRWTKKLGVLGWTREAGLEFFDVGPKTKTILQQLAGRVAYNETVRG